MIILRKLPLLLGPSTPAETKDHVFGNEVLFLFNFIRNGDLHLQHR